MSGTGGVQGAAQGGQAAAAGAQLGPRVERDANGRITLTTIPNPQPPSGDRVTHRTQALAGQRFPLHRSGSDQARAHDLQAGINALQLGSYVSRDFGTGHVDVTFTVGNDGRISEVAIDTSQFQLAEGMSMEDFTSHVASQVALLHFAPAGRGEARQPAPRAVVGLDFGAPPAR
jgi:hypothetical protein